MGEEAIAFGLMEAGRRKDSDPRFSPANPSPAARINAINQGKTEDAFGLTTQSFIGIIVS
ncbi:MAG TPA: hypothetical protein PLX83_20940 [bacterium]|nr:hypothetical protein [bacterium]